MSSVEYLLVSCNICFDRHTSSDVMNFLKFDLLYVLKEIEKAKSISVETVLSAILNRIL